MAIWALADLHLSFGVPDKEMDVFGEKWAGHAEKIESSWRESVREGDLVLIAGDISWAKKPKEAAPDLAWIEGLPGKKLLVRGNHDYWWSSQKKLKQLLPPSIEAIHNDVALWKDWEIGGARLWDTPEYSFDSVIEFVENPAVSGQIKPPAPPEEQERIFQKELHRLKLSLDCFRGEKRIAMTHYPPIGAELAPSRASELLEEYQVSYCLFGHLHSVEPGALPFGERGGVRYLLTSCDYLDFKPLLVVP